MKSLLLVYIFLILSVTGFSQNLDGNITSSSPAICSGAAVVLTVNGTGGTPGYSYLWLTTGENTQSIAVKTERTYIVRITDQTGAIKDVSINIAANTTPDAPTVINRSGAVCFNSSARLEASAAPGATFIWYANQQGGDPLFAGAVFNTPPITAPSIYYVEALVNGCVSTRTVVSVSLVANPKPVGATVCANNVAVLTASGAVDYRWWDAPTGGTQVGSGATFITPVLTVTRTYYLEGITSAGCVTERIPVVATVTRAPAAPNVPAPPYVTCINSRITLQATGQAGVLFNWFDVAEGGASLITSPDYTTPVLSADKSYWVQATLNGCPGPRREVKVIVNAIPAAPQASSNGAVCINSPATLRVTSPVANTSYQWFETATSSTSVFTGTVFNTPPVTAPVTYYVRAVNGPCRSEAFAVQVDLLPAIDRPVISGATLICQGSTPVLSISQPNANYIYDWFSTPNGATPIQTGTTFNTPILNKATTFYVQARSGNCVSARTAFTISLLPPPPAPTTSPVAAICYNTAATVVANNGTSYRWYAAASGGLPLSSDRVFTTGPLTANTTFYVTNLVDGCESTRTAVNVSVNPALPPPVVANPGNAVCPGTIVVLQATTSNGVLQWFSSPNGGNMAFQGPNYSVTVNTTTTFYVQAVIGACVSERTAVTVNVLPAASAQFAYSAGTYCHSSGNQTPTISTPGGTFTASAGLVWQNQSNGTINIAATSLGRYTISYKNTNGTCDVTTTATINIVATANAEFTYNNAAFCQGDNNPRPQFTPTSSGGVFTASPGGLVIDSSTGVINLSASQPGIYTITNKVALTACSSTDEDTFQIEIRASVIARAGNDRYAPREPFTLTGTISRPASVTWTTSNGLGVITNPNSLNGAVYTPHPNDVGVKFILTANDAGLCGPQTAQVTITFLDGPNTGVTTDTVCVGNAATLTAAAPGATSYHWFNVATGGSSLYTGAVYTTAPLTIIGVSNFWVEARVNGISGPRKQVDVEVTGSIGAPQVTGETDICTGSTWLLVASAVNATNYRWFNKDMLPISMGSTLSVPVFTNTSYFVQAEANGCKSAITEVKLTVKQVPRIISDPSGRICSGAAQNYLVKADIIGTTFSWSRAGKPAINSNQPASGTGDSITELLVSTAANVQTVTYVITPTSPNGCSGTPFNYNVTVYPAAALTSPAQASVCDNKQLGYLTTFNTALTAFSWSRDAVAGISNSSVADQASYNIREALNNTTNEPVITTYRYTVTTASGCTYTIALPVTVNPTVTITSESFTLACSNVPFVYQITSNVVGATYNWVRNAVGSNPAATANGVTAIQETLRNNTGKQLDVYYLITPVYNGCESRPFTYHVIFNPQPLTPVLNANIPVCEEKTLTLQTDRVTGASYKWTFPDGTSKVTTNPILNVDNVTMAHAGTYSLVVILNGCSSEPGTRVVIINRKPVANAGPPQTVCPTATVVNLNGSASGGPDISGLWSGGTGTFSAIYDLKARYFPSDQDRANGSVTLTLTTASPDDCTPAVAQVRITFGLQSVVDAGADQVVCSQDVNVNVKGVIAPGKGNAFWSGGTGSFDDRNQSSTIYHPTKADIAAGFVILKLRATAAGVCDLPEDEIKISFASPPRLAADALPFRSISPGGTITLNPVVSDQNVTYFWTPAAGLNDRTVKNPIVTGGDKDVTYTLLVTNALGCQSTAEIFIKVSPVLTMPNTITPNADGINDVWLIDGAEAYPKMIVSVYNKSGQPVYRSVGYAQPWDGTTNGMPVPFGVYYFVIDTKESEQKVSGYITVIR